MGLGQLFSIRKASAPKDGLEFHQGSIGAIRRSLDRYVVQCLVTLPIQSDKTDVHTDRQTQILTTACNRGKTSLLVLRLSLELCYY